MSFAAPLVLLALLAIPAARRRCTARTSATARRAAAAFAAPALHAVGRAATARAGAGTCRCSPSCSRSAILILAAARPQQTVAVPVERASIMLVDRRLRLDAGHRRAARRGSSPRAARRQALRRRRCPRRSTSASWRFNQHAARAGQRRRATASPSTHALDQLTPSGGTGDRRGDRRPRPASCKRAPGVERQAPAGGDRAALRRRVDRRRSIRSPPRRPPRKLHIPIYTVALGTPRGHDHRPAPGRPAAARDRAGPARPAVARARSRRPPAARPSPRPTPTGLSDVYERLGSQLGHQEREAPDHGRLRRRRPRAAARRRRHVPALVRPPDLRRARRTA